MSKSTEFIVVGGGASGCATTSSLLKNKSKVTLFEAGPIHHNFYLDIPSGFLKYLTTISMQHIMSLLFNNT